MHLCYQSSNSKHLVYQTTSRFSINESIISDIVDSWPPRLTYYQGNSAMMSPLKEKRGSWSYHAPSPHPRRPFTAPFTAARSLADGTRGAPDSKEQILAHQPEPSTPSTLPPSISRPFLRVIRPLTRFSSLYLSVVCRAALLSESLSKFNYVNSLTCPIG